MHASALRPSLRHGFILFTLAATAAAACDNEVQTTGGGGEGAGAGGPPATSTATSQSSTTGMGGEGGEGGSLPAPPLRNPVDMEDSQLAYQSLLLMGYEALGATTTRCTECHEVNRGLLTHWRDLTDDAVAGCLSDTTVPTKASAEEILDCLRLKPGNPMSPFSTPKLGIYAAAAHLDWFAFTFDRALDEQGVTALADFENEVGMPKEMQTPFTQGELDIVAEWVARGLPYMEEFVPDENFPGSCIPNITPAVATHINEMKTSGWRAVNAENDLLMFGCAGAATPLDCLATYPQAGTLPFGTGWENFPGAKLRVLYTYDYSSSFWTRSSADGRFVGHGGGSNGNSTIIDLLGEIEIAVDAAYDPGFFPDNSGFMFQGTNQGTGICLQSLLNGSATIDFTEPECNNTANVGLYQHIGAALGGGDYWAVDSGFVSDNGGHIPTHQNPSASWGSGADIDLTPMVYDGNGYVQKPAIEQSTPFEGDTVMSPSTRLLLARSSGGGFQQNGFTMRRLDATPSGQSYTVQTPEIARYCFNGGKPGISYDERWAVIHRYVTGDDAMELGFTGAGDPGFAPYASQGAANVYLLDLLTGLTRRITHMKPGQYALFPHFRSDGWIYFIVRTQGTDQEHIVAGDAALLLEAQ